MMETQAKAAADRTSPETETILPIKLPRPPGSVTTEHIDDKGVPLVLATDSDRPFSSKL